MTTIRAIEARDLAAIVGEPYSVTIDEPGDSLPLLQILLAPFDRIVKKCKVRQWNWKELMDACKRRLLPGRSRNQVLLELAKVEVKLDDDPEKIMARIEAITPKQAKSTHELQCKVHMHYDSCAVFTSSSSVSSSSASSCERLNLN